MTYRVEYQYKDFGVSMFYRFTADSEEDAARQFRDAEKDNPGLWIVSIEVV